jgi:hypothetical protein
MERQSGVASSSSLNYIVIVNAVLQIQKSIEFLRVILLPVNVNKSHWVLIHCDLERQVIRILDSLPSNYQKQIGNHNWLKSRHAKLVEVSFRFLT